MLNFTLRAFGLGPLHVAGVAYVSDSFEVELRMKRKFGCRSDCGRSREMLKTTLEEAREELGRLEQLYPVEV
jgi:bacterioferritin-associated ferredoxin